MNTATLDALHTLAISIQAAMHDNRRDDVIHLAAQVARLIREQTETPTLVERNTGGCPTCGDMAHAWTSPALDGYIDACLRHRNQIMRDAVAHQNPQMLGIPYTASAIEGTNPNGYKR